MYRTDSIGNLLNQTKPMNSATYVSIPLFTVNVRKENVQNTNENDGQSTNDTLEKNQEYLRTACAP